MRLAPLVSTALLTLVAASASAVTMAWTPIGNPGNACETQSQGCFGAVSYRYDIGTYEVTNAQYVEFLNAKAGSDPLGLYNTTMATNGGIAQSGSDGSYTYSAIAGRENIPAVWVSFYDALRFANWMSNGQGNGDTESGSYTLLGGTATPTNGTTVTRNPGATIVLPNENEWYKAAYYNASTASYFDYPTGSDDTPTCAGPAATPNSANCSNLVLTAVGFFTASPSPYGTFDQGGNAAELNETPFSSSSSTRVFRGGSWVGYSVYMASVIRNPGFSLDGENGVQGFRLAMVPEPGTGVLVLAGLLGLAGGRRARA